MSDPAIQTEAEVKGRFKVKHVKPTGDEADHKTAPTGGGVESGGDMISSTVQSSATAAAAVKHIDAAATQESEIIGRFKVKHVKQSDDTAGGNEVKNKAAVENSSSTGTANSGVEILNPQSEDGKVSGPVTSGTVAKKSRFTVLSGGSGSPSKHLPPSSNDAGPTPTIVRVGSGGTKPQVAVADEKTASEVPAAPTSTTKAPGRKSKSRFTVKTIPIEDDKETSDHTNQSSAGVTCPSPTLRPLPTTRRHTSQGLESTPGDTDSPLGLQLLSLQQQGGAGRLQQLLESNYHILASIQSALATSSDARPRPSSAMQQPVHQQQPSRPPATQQTGGVGFKPIECHTAGNSEVPPPDALHTTRPPSISTNSSREKDKPFGNMLHHLNEMKKEVDEAAHAGEIHQMEKRMLRVKCAKLEEKLQFERNVRASLEERLEKALQTQRQLQQQVDALLHQQQHGMHHEQQQACPILQGGSDHLPVPTTGIGAGDTRNRQSGSCLQEMENAALCSIGSPSVASSLGIGQSVRSNGSDDFDSFFASRGVWPESEQTLNLNHNGSVGGT
mmetsp:Transcript_14020/g.20966  ORF Transcript_14020/g.20966 Transcript_14020/m.20966 type:complete len:558 (-) Transcript_14020:192-1865(-)|eukprot:CAMPEP_0185030826 /NCGR_PEP_ID=MMETSP1103-20130426/17906_1 /TAXON_ID=36769 /ORGANISM="Paraphysomonas bandaiensis, Strain Caron Lab Isolate" /LENGTH=557 /DNA_ID=CAMNT_0027566095 /DNA_START=163 /DNA_END=1836 /DNA_ORIENTATION=+